jgi:hypothetical protein
LLSLGHLKRRIIIMDLNDKIKILKDKIKDLSIKINKWQKKELVPFLLSFLLHWGLTNIQRFYNDKRRTLSQ